MRNFTFPVGGESIPVHSPETSEDLGAFFRWLRRQPLVAVDTEGRGLHILGGQTSYIRVVQFGNATEAWNINLDLGFPFHNAARWALETVPRIVGHNWHSFDALALSVALGLNYDMLCRKAEDTMIYAKLVDPRKQMEGGIGAGLKPLSAHYIDPDAADTQGDLTAVFRSLKLTKSTGFASIDLWHPIYQSYAGGDVILTYRLRGKLIADLDRLGVPKRLREYEHELARICGHMQKTGFILDQDYTRTLSTELGEEAEKYTLKAQRYGVDKIGSPKQLAEAFLGMGEVLTERTDNGALQVNKQVLAKLADIDFQSGERLNKRTPNSLAEAVIKAKRASKWQSAYADNFLSMVDTEGRMHPGIQTLAARTGRMSITNPAVQTLPSGDWKIRRCFLAEPGHVMISTDFQAVELRVLAALADVKKMKEAINAGEDLHSYTARLVYGPNFTKAHRKICKGVAFGTVYGGGAATISDQTGAPLEAAKTAQQSYHRAYPEIRRAANRWQREAFDNGMVTTSVTGRRMPLDRDRAYAVTNYQVQSAARDCLGQSIIDMDKKGLTPYLRLPVHDEVLASAPKKDAQEIGNAISKCMTFSLYGVPIEASPEIGGRSWGSLYGADV